MSRLSSLAIFAAVSFMACAWDHGGGEVCQSYGSAWCEGNRIMWCSEGGGLFEDDQAWASEDCGEVGASCFESSGNVACVFHDQPCEGESVCVGSVQTACVGGFTSTRDYDACEHDCERLDELDDTAHCSEPSSCAVAGSVECTAPSTRHGELARYSICLRAGWALRYSCVPDYGGYGGCSELVAEVPCSVRRVDDADAGAEGAAFE